MRSVIHKALLLTVVCGTMLAVAHRGNPPFSATTTANTKAEFQQLWAHHFHLNASRVNITSFEPFVNHTGGHATFYITGEGHGCDKHRHNATHPHGPNGSLPHPHGSMPRPTGLLGAKPESDGSLPHPHGSMPRPTGPNGVKPESDGSLPHPHGSMPRPTGPSGMKPESDGSLPHPHGSMPRPTGPNGMKPESDGSLPHPHGSMPHPTGPNGVKPMKSGDAMVEEKGCNIPHRNDLSGMSVADIDALLHNEHGLVFQMVGVFKLSHGNWSWAVNPKNGADVKPHASFEVVAGTTQVDLVAEINRVSGSVVASSAVCDNTTHEVSHQHKRRPAVKCDVEFVSSTAALQASTNANANVYSMVYSAASATDTTGSEDTPSDSTTSSSTPLIAGVAAGVFAVVGAAVVAGVLVQRRRVNRATSELDDEDLMAVRSAADIEV